MGPGKLKFEKGNSILELLLPFFLVEWSVCGAAGFEPFHMVLRGAEWAHSRLRVSG